MFDEDQLNRIENWKRIKSIVNVNFNDENCIENEENIEINESRAWSRYQTNNQTNLFEQTTLTTKQVDQHQIQIETILNYLDKRRINRVKKVELNIGSLFGTMADFQQWLDERDSFGQSKFLLNLIIYLDSVFRGVSQVMFANSPLSGLIIFIGLLIGNWELGLYGLLGTCVSTLTAYLFDVNWNSIRSGLFGYNGCLTAMGICYFSYSKSIQMFFPIVLLSIFSTLFSIAIGKILVEKLRIPPFTFSFQISVWIWLLASLKTRYFFIDGTILSPNLLTTYQIKPILSNISYETYSVADEFRGFLTSISQVYFIDNPYTGVIIIVGVAFCSRILSLMCLFGSVTSQLSASYMFGVSRSSIRSGLWGYNSVLTCEAIGGLFFVLNGYSIWLIVFYSSLMTVVVQMSVSAFLSSCGMATLTFPFTFVCWIFCLIGRSKYLIGIELDRVSLPEDHRRRYRFSTFIHRQFESLNYLKYLNLSHNQHFQWDQIIEIHKRFFGTLICSYIYENNFKELKRFRRENRNNLNYFDDNSRSALHISVSCGNMKISKWLIEKVDLNVNSKDRFGNSPLFDALINGQFHLLEYLYKKGSRFPPKKSKELSFYLNGFVSEKNYFLIELLLSCGLNVNCCDQDGRTALHTAVLTNQFDVVQFLLTNYPIWLDIKDFFNLTAIDYARQLIDPTIANYLSEIFEKNPIPSRLTINNQQFLKQFKDEYFEEKIREKKEYEIEHLFYPKLFNLILTENNFNSIKEFIDDHRDQNPLKSFDYDLRTVAHYAANRGDLQTFIYLSSNYSFDEFVQLMFREDRWNLSPIDEIFVNNHIHLIQFLNEYFQNQSINYSSIDDSNTTNLVLSSLKTWQKIYLFLNLASTGQSQRIDYLFQRKYFQSNQLYCDYHFRTPAHFASANGHFNVIQVLTKYHFIGLNLPDRWGLTPLHHYKLNQFQNISK